MSSSSTIVNDREHGDSVQQPSTAAGRRRGTRSRLCVTRSSPSADGNPSADATTPRRQTTPPTPAVEPGTGAGNPRCGRPRRTGPTEAVQPGSRGRNTTRRRPTRPSTTDEEPGTDEENNRPTRPRRLTVFERDLTPAERAIPDTDLLHDLGYHLSAYARAGRGPPTQNLNCRGAWETAVKLYHLAHDRYKDLFDAAGFRYFLEIEPVDVPKAYNLALTERWFSETNTLHLPTCEIGPTPVDWTMVTGLSFGGRRIKVNPDFSIKSALELLGKPGAKKDGKIHLEAIKPSKNEVMRNPPNDDVMKKVFRRLFLYVVGSCFFNNNRSVISHYLVECLETIGEVGLYNWGEVTYATFLAGMRRKVTAEIGAFTAFWQFLPFWAFEYLDVNRPPHNEADVFPRARRWICPKGFSENESPQFIGPQFSAYRCQLNYLEESQVTWQPYSASAKFESDDMESTINLAKMRRSFQGIDTWEYYLGERCLRQLGFPCQVPHDPPQIMYGQDDTEILEAEAENLVREDLDYVSWFANNSIGITLDVTRFLGGPDVAGKFIDQWRAKYHPDLILIEQSEYEKMKEDCTAIEEECAKLREELSQARRDGSSHV